MLDLFSEDKQKFAILQDDEDEVLWVVEKILDKKKEGNKIKYKVKWKGFSLDECTWEPRSNLETVLDLITEFE